MGIMLFTTIGNLLFFLEFTNHFKLIAAIANAFAPIIILIYTILSYFKACRKDYTSILFLIPMQLFLVLGVIELIVFMLLIFGNVTN